MRACEDRAACPGVEGAQGHLQASDAEPVSFGGTDHCRSVKMERCGGRRVPYSSCRAASRWRLISIGVSLSRRQKRSIHLAESCAGCPLGQDDHHGWRSGIELLCRLAVVPAASNDTSAVPLKHAVERGATLDDSRIPSIWTPSPVAMPRSPSSSSRQGRNGEWK